MGAKISHTGPLVYQDSIEKSLLQARIEPLLTSCVEHPENLVSVCVKYLKPMLTTGPDKHLACQIVVDSIKWKMKQLEVPIKQKYFCLQVLRLCMEFQATYLPEYTGRKMLKRLRAFCLLHGAPPAEKELALQQFSSTPDPEFTDKVFGLILELVQYWGTGKPLEIEQVEMPTQFGKLYSQLLGQGVEFPKENVHMREFTVDKATILKSSIMESLIELSEKSRSGSPHRTNEKIMKQMSNDVKRSNLGLEPQSESPYNQDGATEDYSQLESKIHELKLVRSKIQATIFSDGIDWTQRKKETEAEVNNQMMRLSTLRKEINSDPRAIRLSKEKQPRLKELIITGKQEINIAKEVSRGWNIYGLDGDLTKLRHRLKLVVEKETSERLSWNQVFLREFEDGATSNQKYTSLENLSDTTPRFKPVLHSDSLVTPQQQLVLHAEELLPDSPDMPERILPLRKGLTFEPKELDGKEDLNLEDSMLDLPQRKPLSLKSIEMNHSQRGEEPVSLQKEAEKPYGVANANSKMTLQRLASLTLGPDTWKNDSQNHHPSARLETSHMDSPREDARRLTAPENLQLQQNSSPVSHILAAIQQERDQRERFLLGASLNTSLSTGNHPGRVVRQPSEYISRDQDHEDHGRLGYPPQPHDPKHLSQITHHQVFQTAPSLNLPSFGSTNLKNLPNSSNTATNSTKPPKTSKPDWQPAANWQTTQEPSTLVDLLATVTYHDRECQKDNEELRNRVSSLQDRKIELLRMRNALKQVSIENHREILGLPKMSVELVHLRRELLAKQAELNLVKHKHAVMQKELDELHRPIRQAKPDYSHEESTTMLSNNLHNESTNFLDQINKQVDDLLEKSFATRGRGEPPIISD